MTGFVVDSVEEAVQAVGRVASLSRHACRGVFEERFDAAHMARDYLEIYRRLAYIGAELVPTMPYDTDLPLGRSGQCPERHRFPRSHVPLLGALPGTNSQALRSDST